MNNVAQNSIKMDERQITKAMWGPNAQRRPIEFRAYQLKTGKWVVKFRDKTASDYILVMKIRGNKIPKIREFSRLNGVQMWMQKMEIRVFTVLLCSQSLSKA